MKILFTKNVTRQGQMGEVKEVANGFAQFLINAGNAVVATDAVIAVNKKKIEEAQMRAKGEESYTIDVAKRLDGKEIKIKGEIFDDKWKNFAQNRTKALNHAYKKSDYLLIFDADDEIVGDFQIPFEKI